VITWDVFLRAIKTLSRFSIMIMEWIDTPEAVRVLEEDLGFKQQPKLILPYEINNRVNRTALVPLTKLLTSEEYHDLAKKNMYDLLFYHVARRMFLERVNCS
jgi:hypothetical protein